MKKHIIPYPGLRPFSEEEAIFFKGRDLHIHQIISQLQERKIVIVTGASGDGKSSLIYAGVVPNARAGFFKAAFNQWVIADFRPERSPLHNLSRSLAMGLNMDEDFVFNELQFGFSSLVNVYKQSKYFIDYNSSQWKSASEEERKKLRSSAANLLIIADQFEEFFTNPENFAAGKPSIEAYTTVNLLLETARIALRENLPIYIIFTMRSDYISDCVAFKGLPEFIGFSQFFVPRLKRTELRQVIEEPARLAGGKVSNRLTEVLINDLREGHDQLPVLQHALNRLWRVANYGEEELDLIHLAKIGGLPPEFLDDKDKEIFEQWFDKLDDRQKVYFENPSLNNVLNLHANTLYDSAFEYFNNNAPWAEKNITEDDAKLIIKKAFLGLTRIDEGRAVRNRMTLREITHLINDPHISFEHVNGVINIFREPDSTFIRPFINHEDIDTQYISPDTVLDITHEALIRNWELLKQWEKEEEENYNDFLEFSVQLRRWLDSGKKEEYLLPLGPLAYFEAWYQRAKPNKYWLAKHDRSETDINKKLKKAERLEQQIQEFLQQSRSHIQAIERRKKRIRNIIGIATLIVVLILSGLTAWAIREKRNADIQRRIAEEQKEIAERQKAIAEQQRNEAIRANKIAEQQRIRAEKEALRALKQKRKADSLLKVALRMRAIAEEQRQRAIEEARRAMREKQKADSLRIIAEQQRQKAIEASKRANRLSILSLAQSLAYKATSSYKDVQTNLLLAYYAYILNKQNGGNPYSPEIYNGLFSAFRKINIPYAFTISANLQDFYPIDSVSYYFILSDWRVGIYNIKSRKTKYLKMNKLAGASTVANDIDKVWWNQPDKIFVLSLYNDFDYIDLEKKQLIRVDKDADKLKFAIMLADNRIMAIFSDKIVFYKRSKKGFEKDKTITGIFRGKVVRVTFNPSMDIFYILTRSGKVFKYNPYTGDKGMLVDNNLGSKNGAFSITLSPDEKILVIGDMLGNLYLYNIGDKTEKILEFSISSAAVKQILFDNQMKKLYVLSPDNIINIYQTGHYNERPIAISPTGEKIKRLFLVKDKVVGASDNGSIFWIYPDPDKYAQIIKQHINRNFTDEEWKMFFQNLIPKFDIVNQK